MATREPLGRDRIIDSALRLLETHGAEKLTLTLIAQDLEVTQPALYKHIEGLDAVWRGLGLIERRELADRLTRATVGLSRDDAVRAVAAAWRQFAVDLPHLYAIGTRYPVAGDEELEAAVHRVLEVIVAALRGYDLADDQRLHAAVALRGSLHGFCTFELGDGNPTLLAIDDMYRHTVELFLVGLSALASGTIQELATAIQD